MTSRSFVFLGGLHRSGTSLLHDCLTDHSETSGFRDTGVPEDEGQFLQSVYPIGRTYGGPGIYGFTPAAHLTEDDTKATGFVAGALYEQWAPHWDLRKRVLVEKTPQNLIMSRFLQAQFPQAHFVFIVRHPLANALATAKWAHVSLTTLVCHWLHCHRILRRDVEALRSYQIFRYEDFVASPEICLRQITQAIGIPMEPLRQRIDRNGNRRYEEAWRRLVAAAAAARHADVAGGPDAFRRPRRSQAMIERGNSLLRALGWHPTAELVSPANEVSCLLHHLGGMLPEFGYTLSETSFGTCSTGQIDYASAAA